MRARATLSVVAALAILLAGATMLASAHAGSDQTHAIEQAAAAPYRDALRRDAQAFCGDLTPDATVTVVRLDGPPVTAAGACETAAAGAFMATTPIAAPGVTETVQLTARDIHVAGVHASGVFGAVSRTTSATGTALKLAAPHEISLEQIGGRWLVTSETLLVEAPDCTLVARNHCQRGVLRLVLLIGEPVGSETAIGIPVPKAVKHAGGRVLREFKDGERYTAQSGCLACHRIGGTGNRGPGPNLTHVGSRLPRQAIARTLVNPTAPMPSFRNLPRRKFAAIVRFLSLLK
jgi:hypothetical protein